MKLSLRSKRIIKIVAGPARKTNATIKEKAGKFTKNLKTGFRRLLAWRWFSAVFLLTLYFTGGVITSYLVYHKHAHDQYIDKLLAVYPLPASIASGKVIYVKELYQRIKFAKQFEQGTGQQVGKFDELLSAYLKRMTEDKLINASAENLGIHLSESDINKVLDNLYQKNGGKKEVEETLSSLYKMTLTDFRQLVRYQIVRDIIQKEKISKVSIRHILVNDEVQANKIIQEINNNKISFEDSAKLYSKDSDTRDKGGEIGEVYRGNLPIEIEKLAFDPQITKIGKTYEKPIKTGFGYHIIRVDKRNIGEINTSFDGWVNELKSKNRVHYLFR